LRSSRCATSPVAKGAARAPEKRKPSGFAWPHAVQIVTGRVYGLAVGSTPTDREPTLPGQVLVETVASSRRYWCTNAMAMLPSPTAAATRLTGL